MTPNPDPRWTAIAAEKLPCECREYVPEVKIHRKGCPAGLREVFAHALQDAYDEGVQDVINNEALETLEEK